jgi:2-polyprenyl-6-methoxyphenol hydroxylase-like FAD-dependent oxidoreductase
VSVSKNHQTDVLIVGAGPVGLATALKLARRGIQVQIIDKQWRTGVHSYALATHARSLDLLDELGVLEELSAQGHKVDRLTFYQGEETRGTLSWDALGCHHPHVLVAPQSTLEGALEAGLKKAGARVQWNHRLQELQGATPTAEIARLEQVASGYPIARMEWSVAGVSRTEATFVVGSDGYRSQVREKIGIKIEQVAEPDTFSVFECDAPMDLGHEVRVVLDEGGTSVLWPMKDGRCRWSFQIASGDHHRPNLEGLNALIRARAPWFPATTGPIHWSSAVMFARRLAGGLGQGSIWLAGDAAHMAGPAGVQSMNAGLIEGCDLADRLAEILEKKAALTLLDDYQTGTIARWRTLLDLDQSLKATEKATPWVAENAAAILGTVPATGGDLAALLAQIGLQFDSTAG